MPSGYTAIIKEKDDLTFEQFALQCARAMGALITMRDDPFDAPIPERFEPSDYHAKQLEICKLALAEVQSLTPEQAHARANKTNERITESAKQVIQEADALRAKYEAMLANVIAWTPPTDDHKELKAFMKNQILESIKWDCSTEWAKSDLNKTPKSGAEWQRDRIAGLIDNIAYHTRENLNEIERTESRNKWIAQLRESLKGPNELSNKPNLTASAC